MRKRARAVREERQKQIAEVTLRLVAEHGVHGTTVSRRASAVGLSPTALYACFPNRGAILEAACALLTARVSEWVARSSGDTAFERLLNMGNRFSRLATSDFNSFVRPWFQFAVAGGTSTLTREMATTHLSLIQGFVLLIEQGKRDGSIREETDTNVTSWALTMWAWGALVARLIELEQAMGAQTSIEILRRMIGDIAKGRQAEAGQTEA